MWQQDGYYRPTTLEARDRAVAALSEMLAGMVEELAEQDGAEHGRAFAEIARVATFAQSIAG